MGVHEPRARRLFFVKFFGGFFSGDTNYLLGVRRAETSSDAPRGVEGFLAESGKGKKAFTPPPEHQLHPPVWLKSQSTSWDAEPRGPAGTGRSPKTSLHTHLKKPP